MRPNNKKSSITVNRIKECYFCVNGLSDIDYKEIRILQKFLSGYGKILPHKRTGNCIKHQRKLALAIKRSRIMALIPFVAK